jgi:hypothetical protein
VLHCMLTLDYRLFRLTASPSVPKIAATADAIKEFQIDEVWNYVRVGSDFLTEKFDSTAGSEWKSNNHPGSGSGDSKC